MKEAIDQIDAETNRLRQRIAELERARELLLGLAKPETAEPKPSPQLAQRADKSQESLPRGAMTDAIRYAVKQMRGLFLTSDVAGLVLGQGYTREQMGNSISVLMQRLESDGFITRISTSRGHGGNTWIKTAELE